MKKRPFCVVRIVDDDAGVRDSYRFLVETDGWFVKTYTDAEDFIQNNDPTIPGCAVLDVRMPGLSGLELQEYLEKLSSRLPIVFISAHANVEMVVRAIKHGAIDFLPKPVDDAKLLEAVEKAVCQSFENQKEDLELANLRQKWESLSQREKETARQVGAGILNKLIADGMHITERTVQVHRASVYQKLGVKNAVELSKLLARLGDP